MQMNRKKLKQNGMIFWDDDKWHDMTKKSAECM